MDELEAHPSGMDSDDLEADSGGSKLPLLALIVAAIGMALGIAGIYMAAQATHALQEYQDAEAAQPDTSAPRLEALEERLEQVDQQLVSIEERLGNMGSAQVAQQRGAREMREQMQQAFERISREVSANRTQINGTNARLEELMTNLQSGAARRAPATSSGSGASATPSGTADSGSNGGSSAEEPEQASAEGGVHVVASGDTLSSIASRYGISLSALLNANPGVDPRRLRIGQQVTIPGQ